MCVNVSVHTLYIILRQPPRFHASSLSSTLRMYKYRRKYSLRRDDDAKRDSCGTEQCSDLYSGMNWIPESLYRVGPSNPLEKRREEGGGRGQISEKVGFTRKGARVWTGGCRTHSLTKDAQKGAHTSMQMGGAARPAAELRR